MSVNYDRVCRLCLSSRGELLPIFPTTSSEDTEPPILASKIKDCVAIQITEDDNLPTCVCKKCADNVNNWHIFKAVCDKSQNKLQSLLNKDGNQLEEVKVKSEPFSETLSDDAYDDGVVIDGSYQEQNATTSNKVQPEGPPILASLGLTPRSDKGAESEKDEEEEEEDEEEEEVNQKRPLTKVPNMPEVSITVMRPTGETLHARQGIQQLASKNCLLCERTYRYSHNARRHELTAHNFDRYTNKVINNRKTNQTQHMPPKYRPNPFNPKARMMPNPISHKMQYLPKSMPTKMVPHKVMPKSLSVKAIPAKVTPNNLPYPLRIKALKDLQIKKKEPQILKTLLTSKPEVLVSEPEIMNSGPESPETLISEPEIASFQVEAILSEPDGVDQQPGEDEMDGEARNTNQSGGYGTVDMESDNEIEIARLKDTEDNEDQNDENGGEMSDNENNGDDNQIYEDNDDNQGEEVEGQEEGEESYDAKGQEGDDADDGGDEYQEDGNQEENDEEEDDDDLPPMGIAPVVEISEGQENTLNSENNDENENEEELDESVDPNEMAEDDENKLEIDPDKHYVTKTQKDFILKHRDIIEQINTKRCLCCNKDYPRRKAVIQHLQKSGKKVPKHTCYNCVITFSHIGAFLSHMRADICTNLWKVIYNENGISDDMVIQGVNKDNKVNCKDVFNARSYACKLCPAKFQLKQFILKHVLDVHEDGQSRVNLACVHCRSRFKDRNVWKRHVRNGECTIYIACDLCPEKFGSIQDFNDHALSIHAGSFDPENQIKCVDVRPTDCPICEKKNCTYQNLIKHLKLFHNEDKPHYCQNCDSKFEKAEELNNHIYLEHSDKAMGMEKSDIDMSIVKEEAEEYHYSCTECNAIFETVDAWTDHQVAEHNQVAHHCDQCEKKFLRPSELAEHKNTHLRVKLYPCSLCSDSYSTPQKLADHVQQTHPGAATFSGDPTASEFYCGICIRSFKSRQAYSNHMRIHAKVPTTNRKPGELKSFAPQIIGKPIKQFSMVQASPNFQYKPSNVPNAPYCCDICGKGFMHKKNIWKHKKVLHADLVNDRNDSEENTMHASTEEDEYNMDENGATLTTPQFNSFNFANYANNVPAKPGTPSQPAAAAIPEPQVQQTFSCDLCYKKFPLKTSLWKHKRAKHGIINASSASSESPMTPAASGDGSRSSCTICQITFSDKKSYYRHRKNVHKTAVHLCKICGVPLSSTQELYEHLRASHARELLGFDQGGARPDAELDVDCQPDDPAAEYQARYPCDSCGKQFVGLLALQNHQCVNQLSSQPQSFTCEICNKSYLTIAALKSHRGWHLRSPDGKAAANNTGLWMPHHKVTTKVSKQEILDPSQLAKVTHSSPAAAIAKRRLPPEVEVTVVNPNKKLRSDDSVELEQGAPPSGVEDRYCTICDKEFTKRAAYQRHMDEVHQPNSVFCPVCDKSFTRKSTLLVHMRKHYEGSGSAGGSAGAPEESAESEDDEPPPPPPAVAEFTCAQCGDGVATPRDLLAHRTMHATPTKYFCSVCKVYYSRSVELSAHTRARHAAETDKQYFPCAMCDRFYMNKKSLQRHLDLAH